MNTVTTTRVGSTKPGGQLSQTDSRSLCSTCAYSAGCQYRQRSDGPVIFCEEFDCGEVHGERRPIRIDVSSLPHQPPAEDNAGETLKGLCLNCDNRSTCRLPKPEGGIWHCEEYA